MLAASQGAPAAKPLSECGQGIPVYAAGTEIRTGTEGLMTSDWGNKIFVQTGKDSEFDRETASSRCSISFCC